MGSFQQIFLAGLCLAAAFGTGHYLNNQPIPDQVADSGVGDADSTLIESPTSFLEFDESSPQHSSMEVMRDSRGSSVPMLRLSQPSATPQVPARGFPDQPLANRMESQLPPPSELNRIPMTETQPARMPNLLATDRRREIDVPDFSQLAMGFKNTPLELPDLKGTRGVRHPVSDFDDLDPYARSNPQSKKPASHNPASHDPPSRSNDTWSNSEVYQVQSIPVDFSADDFQPKLKGRMDRFDQVRELNAEAAASRPTVNQETGGLGQPFDGQPMKVQSSNQIVDNSIFDRPDHVDSWSTPPETPELRIQASPLPARNGVVSLQQNSASERNWNPSDSSVNISSPEMDKQSRPDYRVAKPRVPFGLTVEAKTELVGLRKSAERQLKLGATRYQEHVTQIGDTLPDLSTKYYGRPDFYLDIYLANQHVLRNPAEVADGLRLKIPVYE